MTSAAPGGLGLEQLLALLAHIAERGSVGALTLSAYGPAADRTGAVARAAVRVGEVVVFGASARG